MEGLKKFAQRPSMQQPMQPSLSPTTSAYPRGPLTALTNAAQILGSGVQGRRNLAYQEQEKARTDASGRVNTYAALGFTPTEILTNPKLRAEVEAATGRPWPMTQESTTSPYTAQPQPQAAGSPFGQTPGAPDAAQLTSPGEKRGPIEREPQATEPIPGDLTTVEQKPLLPGSATLGAILAKGPAAWTSQDIEIMTKAIGPQGIQRIMGIDPSAMDTTPAGQVMPWLPDNLKGIPMKYFSQVATALNNMPGGGKQLADWIARTQDQQVRILSALNGTKDQPSRAALAQIYNSNSFYLNTVGIKTRYFTPGEISTQPPARTEAEAVVGIFNKMIKGETLSPGEVWIRDNYIAKTHRLTDHTSALIREMNILISATSDPIKVRQAERSNPGFGKRAKDRINAIMKELSPLTPDSPPQAGPGVAGAGTPGKYPINTGDPIKDAIADNLNSGATGQEVRDYLRSVGHNPADYENDFPELKETP